MSDLPDIPGVPTKLDSQLRGLLASMRDALRELQGRTGTGKGRALTFGESAGIGGGTTIIVTGPGGGGGGYTPDYTPPPTPSGVTCGAGIDFISYETDAPTFTEGNGYARTMVYGAKWPSTDVVGPTFGTAVLIDEFVGEVGSRPTDPATRWCLWLKWKSRDGIESVDPAGGTNGLQVTTGQDPTKLLEILTRQITDDQLFPALGDRIDLIDGDASVPGSVNSRVASVAALAGLKNRTHVSGPEPVSDADYTLRTGDLWIDQGSTNHLLRSSAFTQSPWAIAGVSSGPTSGVAAPDGSTDGHSITINAGGYLVQNVVFPGVAGVEETVCWSLYTRAATDVIGFGGSTPAGSQETGSYAVGGGWYRRWLSLRFTPATTGNYTVQAILRGAGSFVIWEAMVERGRTRPGRRIKTQATASSTTGNRKVYAWSGASWDLADDARIAQAVADIQTEVTNRTTADTAEAAVRESLYAGMGASIGTDYKVFNQATSPDATNIGDIWSWKTGAGVETFNRWSGSAWVDSVANKRAAAYRGEYANAAALPTTGNVIGDLAMRTDSTSVFVWNGADWATRTATPSPIWAFTEQERAARVTAVSAEASARELLASTVGDNTAAIELEAITRASQTGDLFAQYTVKLDVGGKVSGFGLASTGPTGAGSTFAIRADRFYVAAPSSASGVADIVPFAVQATPYLSPSGELLPAGVYMPAAYIRDLDVALGRFQNAFITNAMIVSLSASRITSGVISVGNYIQSSNYVPGVSGWKIHGNGAGEFRGLQIGGDSYFDGQVTIRAPDGRIILQSGGKLAAVDITPDSGWLNSTAKLGQNLLANSDQLVCTWSIEYNPLGAVVAIGPVHSSTVGGWSTADWVLSAGATNGVAVKQQGSVSGGETATAFDLYPLGTRQASSVACIPGERFFAAAYLQTQHCFAEVYLRFYALDGSNLASFGSGFVTDSGYANTLASHTRAVAFGTAPAGSATVVLMVRKYNTRSGVDSHLWLAAPQISPANAEQAQAGPYQPGPPAKLGQLGYVGDLNAENNSRLSMSANGQLLNNGDPLSGGVTLSGIGAKALAFLDMITAAAASTYIEAASITLAHIKVASIGTLGALSSYLGTVLIAEGGWLRSGQTAWGVGNGFWLGWIGSGPGEPGFSIGSSAYYLRYRPSSGLEIKLDSFQASIAAGGISGSVSSTGTYNFSRTCAVIYGGVAPFSYQWTVTDYTAAGGGAIFSVTGGATTDTLGISITINDLSANVNTSITCVVTDSNGRTTTASIHASLSGNA